MSKANLFTSLFVYLLISSILAPRASAQVSSPASPSASQGGSSGNMETTVSASVGEFNLTVSGFISPYASVVMTTTDGTTMNSVVAEATGNFSFPIIPIKRGFAGFCLIATDFNRLGESTTCFPVEPATDSIVMSNIFLPPTLGLSRTEINVGSNAQAFGYTMPNALVTLHLADGITLTTTADSSGHYEFTIENLAIGSYDLFATGEYNGTSSSQPTKKVQLKVLSQAQQAVGSLSKIISNLLDKFKQSLTSVPLVILLGIPIIILIIILLRKLHPDFSGLKKLAKKPAKKLHHWWFVGY